MARRQLAHSYKDIISLENLLAAWQEFAKGKRSKPDVQEFELRLMDNLMGLHGELADQTWRHGPYQSFNIADPKPRNIHKARVRDRVLHHAVYRKLYPFFDRTFIADSYSCRIDKGTHKALNRFRTFGRKVAMNGTGTGWVLKCDIRKFFASIDQAVLLYILSLYLGDRNVLRLLEKIIGSFYSTVPGKGLPLGNLTSQLLVNVYMNEFDQFVKHRLKARFYLRYADDFVILSHDKGWLAGLLLLIKDFLAQVLLLELHPDKILIQTVASGVDYLGWVHFSRHRVLRTTTKRRIQRKLRENPEPQTLASYLGLISHGNTERFRVELLSEYERGRDGF